MMHRIQESAVPSALSGAEGSQKSEVRSQNQSKLPFFLLSSVFCLLTTLCASAAFAQAAPAAATAAAGGQALTEVEVLKGENLRLRYDSLDKQLRLMELQYAQLREQQAQAIRELQQLEQDIVAARQLAPGEWTVNWAAKTVEAAPHRSGNAEKLPERKE